MKRLREAMRKKKKTEAWTNKTWMLHHDNVPAHSSLIRDFLAKHDTTIVPQLPYSPGLAPANLSLFPKLKIHLEKSLISDDKEDRRKFAAGPVRHPEKRVPGCVPEM